LAPKADRAAASRRLMAGMGLASGTRLGSAVSTPSTSVQICTSSASRASPSRVALVSDPPRPRVVVLPSGAAPRNPWVTQSSPASRACRQGPAACRRASSRGRARPWRLSVFRTDRASANRAPVPCAFKNSATSRAERVSPTARAASRARGEASQRRPMPSSSPASRWNSGAQRGSSASRTPRSRATPRCRRHRVAACSRAASRSPREAASMARRSASVVPESAETTTRPPRGSSSRMIPAAR